MVFQRNTRLLIYNCILLTILFLYFWVKSVVEGEYSNLVYWPGAYLLSIAILSNFISQFVSSGQRESFWKKALRQAVYSLFFGFVHLILTGFIILILERFFRQEEHFTFGLLVDNFATRWFFLFEGAFIYLLYQLALGFIAQREQLNNSKRMFADLERSIVSSNLETLKTELNPHFLYNAMNSISMTIRVGEASKAIDMIANLNELLRVVLSKTKEKFISLSEEIELLNKYLEIEKARFGDRIKVELLFDASTLEAQVPQLILQPIVENAFKHGMDNNLGDLNIVVTSQKLESELLLKVYNTSDQDWSMSNSQTERKGIGLNNVIHRLRQLYSTYFKFETEEMKDGIEFRIVIPFSI